MEPGNEDQGSNPPGLRSRPLTVAPCWNQEFTELAYFHQLSNGDRKLWLPPPRVSLHLNLDLSYQQIFMKVSLKKLHQQNQSPATPRASPDFFSLGPLPMCLLHYSTVNTVQKLFYFLIFVEI